MTTRFALALSLPLWGCGAEEAPAPADAVALSPTLADLQTHVFEPGCAFSGCHGADTLAGGLDLSSAEATHASLFDVPAANELAALNGWVRVLPGDPEKSFLVRKLTGPGPGEGSAMPNAAQELDPYYMDLLRTWIEEGAQP